MVRYPAYRSRFIRELARNLDVAAFVGEQLDTEIVSHSLTGLSLAHFNYAPDDSGSRSTTGITTSRVSIT